VIHATVESPTAKRTLFQEDIYPSECCRVDSVIPIQFTPDNGRIYVSSVRHLPILAATGSLSWNRSISRVVIFASETFQPEFRSNHRALTAQQGSWAAGHTSGGENTVCPAARGVALSPPRSATPMGRFLFRRKWRYTRCLKQFALCVTPPRSRFPLTTSLGGIHVQFAEHLKWGTSA